MKSSTKFSFIALTNAQEWDMALHDIGDFDFYHTFGYHELSAKEEEKPVLLVYKDENVRIALPIIIRPIPGTPYFDATSVYGYAGPVSKWSKKAHNNANFKKELLSFLKKQKIISVFSRLNPYITDQDKVLHGMGDISELGNIVYLDLKSNPDEQKTVFSKTTKRYLKKLRNFCDIHTAESPQEIKKFIELYHENMKRVNAAESYFFEESYFFSLLGQTSFKSKVFFVTLKETKEIISAAMMMYTNNDIVQYHISGTSDKYLHLSPIRLIIDEVRIKSYAEGYRVFNLGGGLGSKEDSLFNFKASFSKSFKRFRIWKFIVDETIYNQITQLNKDHLLNRNINFFPIYRYKNNEQET
ncbi:aminoacyltransferase [Flagellimonas sp. HMM57]|uniref:peptidoglycan bridge formation glycyltransferase FemA/FemB family protein n=1 Tax=unclassified Flagellimonas TaxID=2644544 RepID=UPI0013D75176|nr:MULTISPECIES: peptidoglycan bridge formation glycyltransferase FemA/FemB family protein [unclassified Flagellimonas]UII76141.1 aminoacyltransferase [Flagellimonas sp. HMM57]